MTRCAITASGSGSEAVDQLLGELSEDVNVSDFAVLLRLDRALRNAVQADPHLQVFTQADDVQKRLLHHEAAHRDLPVIGVEVAVNRDPAGFGEGDRILDLAALEIALAKLSYLASASRIRRLSVCSSR
jgi:hypothetical protein